MRDTIGLIFVIFSLFYLVLGARYDMIAEGPRNWISDENFKTILELSLPVSLCCNVYISDVTEDANAIFDQFRRIYPNRYNVGDASYDCQGYFLISSTEDGIIESMKKIPALFVTVEMLIIVTGEIIDDSVIFNSSLYQNADLNIVSPSGIWSLSEDYLQPRIFRKMNNYTELIHEYEKCNFQGRELQACSFYRPPATYLQRTVNRTINGRVAEVFLADNDEELDGIELKLFLLMAEKLNFTWTIRKPYGPYRYGRRINKTEWAGGVVQMIRQKTVDVAFASIWMTADQSAFVNLTEHWYQIFIHFLVPRPRPTTSFWGLSKPFSQNLWLLLVFTLLINSFYVFIRARIDPKFPKRFRSFFTSLSELTGRLLGTVGTHNVSHMKIQMLLWHTAGWLIIAAYSSSLAARLAGSDYEARIDTVKQFLKANLTWGRTGAVPPFKDYFNLEDPYFAQLPGKYLQLANDDQVHGLITKGNYAILGKIIGTSFFPEDNVSNEDLKKYRLMRETLGKYYSAFAVQPWLQRPMNRMMIALRESGIILFHLRDVIRRRAKFNLREVLIEYDVNDGHARVLGLTPLGAGFSLLLIGLSMSIFIFYLELKCASGSMSVRQVLRDIDRKREFGKLKIKGSIRNKSFPNTVEY